MVNEFARQGFHFLGSGSLALLAAVLEQHVFLLVVAVAMFVAAVLVRIEVSVISYALQLLDRAGASFAGKGAFMAGLGGFFTVLLFPQQAVGALLVLAVADAAATVVGFYWGSRSVPWSASKTWEGVAAFLICSWVVLAFFTSWWVIIGLFATVVEAADYRAFAFLDDNVLIPLTVASALVLL